MNAHIINIPKEDYFLNTCVNQGFLDVGIVLPKSNTSQGKTRSCGTSYSMFADMKTIRSEDMIFVHAGAKIYGVFKAESEFVEDANISPHYLSNNIYYKNPAIPNSGWQNITNFPPSQNNFRKIAISPFIDNNGNNIAYKKGINSTDVFDLKYKGKIFSVSERWKYPDAARTIRPLMEFEANEILKLIEIENANNANRFNFVALNTSNSQNYQQINLILNNNIVENEKIIEGWICSQIGRNQSVDSIFNEFTSFGNNVPIGYLNFIDIAGYKILPSGTKIFRIIEVKKGDCVFPEDIIQLIKYINKVTEIFSESNSKLVEGFLLAKGFDQKCIDFTNTFNKSGRRISLVKFDYDPPNYQRLNLTRII